MCGHGRMERRQKLRGLIGFRGILESILSDLFGRMGGCLMRCFGGFTLRVSCSLGSVSFSCKAGKGNT